ncbi:hypothetical protein XI07_18840 [Bradyrhizobium sp. CCBAU 11445]|nr:hypothetical protein [Bradyrhizobium sp. CCBAU 21359]MDA9484032.1 hypothetical protein [Bradyrhizobium sp. CCBAU 11445]MDA9522369.1 hypothetical protein [Bradyrhizobium sp. CCBAU 11434]
MPGLFNAVLEDPVVRVRNRLDKRANFSGRKTEIRRNGALHHELCLAVGGITFRADELAREAEYQVFDGIGYFSTSWGKIHGPAVPEQHAPSTPHIIPQVIVMLFQIGEQDTATGKAEDIDFAAPAHGIEPILFDKSPILIEVETLRTVSENGSLGLTAPSSISVPKAGFHFIVAQR